MADPADEAYRRVTNPERYRVLHHAARRLIDELRDDFDVEERTAPTSDPVLNACQVVFDEMVHLVPAGEETSPITFALSDFPAVFVRSGRWQLSAYPGCGCDACDEDPLWVVEQLRKDVEGVTTGRLSEEWDGTWLHVSMTHLDGSSHSGAALRETDRGSLGEPRRYEWRPWSRKPR